MQQLYQDKKALFSQIIALSTAIVSFIGAGCLSEKTNLSDFPGITNRVFSTQDAEQSGLSKKTNKDAIISYAAAFERLQAFRFEAKNSFSFNKAQRHHSQKNEYTVEQTTRGDSHIHIQSPPRQIEVYFVDNRLYIRKDWGQVANQPNNDKLQIPTWAELAFASVGDMLTLVAPQASWSKGTQTTIANRTVTKYKLGLIKKGQAPSEHKNPQIITTTILATAPAADWRQRATATELSGSIWVDQATRVIIRSHLTGQFIIKGQQGEKPITLAASCQSDITNIGNQPDIEAPKDSIKRLYRQPPSPKPLAFFHEYLTPSPAGAPSE